MTTAHDLLNAIHALEPIIRKHADEAELNHRLSQPVVHAMASAGLFRAWVPRTLGGSEVSPLTLYRLVEEIARLDGSTGWCLFVGTSSSITGVFLADLAAEEIFGRDPSDRDRWIDCERRLGRGSRERISRQRPLGLREWLPALQVATGALSGA
jgi:alkylation response protein AidB-like acyl-CoA dehydrogenase